MVCYVISLLIMVPTRLAVQVGLLSKDNEEQVPFAYKLYKSTSKRMKTSPRGSKRRSAATYPLSLLESGEYP
jgi:hypothetical protein